MQSLLDQKLMDQLNAIPSLNEYFNRLPCKTKDWIIEAVKQAVKEWLENKKSHLPPALSSDHEIMACCIYNELIDNLSVQKDAETEGYCRNWTAPLNLTKDTGEPK